MDRDPCAILDVGQCTVMRRGPCAILDVGQRAVLDVSHWEVLRCRQNRAVTGERHGRNSENGSREDASELDGGNVMMRNDGVISTLAVRVKTRWSNGGEGMRSGSTDDFMASIAKEGAATSTPDA
jgi:hypothetical protein